MEQKGQINWKAGVGGGLIILGIYLLSLGGTPNAVGGIISIGLGIAFIAGKV